MLLWKEHKYFDLSKKEHVYHVDVFLEKNEKLEVIVCSEKECLTLNVVPPLSKIHLEVKHTPATEPLKKFGV